MVSIFYETTSHVIEKKSEYLSSARAAATLQKIENWFKKVEPLLDEEDMKIFGDCERVYNVDESTFFLNDNGKIVLAERGEHVYEKNKNSDCENLTVSVCANAAGEFAPSLVVYACERLPAIYKELLPEGWSVRGTENGCRVFCQRIRGVQKKNKHGDKKIIVVFDGHKSHLTLKLSKLASENGIELICLPPSATHIMQPLDVALFKGLKQYWRSERGLYQFEKKKEISKNMKYRSFCKLFSRNISKS